jgi:hypothetical protein
MTTLRHPFEAILSWLDSLPPDPRITIAMGVLIHLPDFKLPDDVLGDDRGLGVLREWLSPNQKRASIVIGKVVTFRALVNFSCRNFFSQERQQYTKDFQLEFKRHLEDEKNHELAKKISDNLQQLPLRNAQWMKIARAWEQLCATNLSDAALDLYERKNPLRL